MMQGWPARPGLQHLHVHAPVVGLSTYLRVHALT